MRQAATAAVLVLMSVSLSFAQTAPTGLGAGVPPVIRFSGTLAVAPGHVPIAFGLYQEDAGGEPLWSETQTLLVDAAGRYSVVLGLTTPLPADVFASGQARWLDVAVEGLAPQPRRLLVSVPYALKASDADTMSGKPLSAFVLAGDRTGVGADGLTYVDTRVLSSALATGASGQAPGGAGSANYIGLFTDTTTLGNSVIYQTPAGSIGVNTTTPIAALHLAAVTTAGPAMYLDSFATGVLGTLPMLYRSARGTPAAPAPVQANDILGGLAVRGYGATAWSTGRGQVMYKAAENWTDAAQGTYLQITTTPIGAATWAERMRVDPSGNVGIGTSAPTSKLSVAGTVESTTGGFLFPDGTTQTTAARSQGTSVAFGYQTLAANTTGSGNTAVGYSALMANTTGNANAAFGYRSLDANTTGSSNHAFGYNALGANTAGFSNNAFGVNSLGANTTGANNNAFGTNALAAAAEAFANNAFGGAALAATTAGMQNAAFGHMSLGANTTGTGNSAFGHNGLFGNTIGNLNAAFGSMSLFANTTGNYNTAVGAWAGHEVTTGSYNTFVGYQAGPDAGGPVISYATAIGANALATASNTMVLGGVLGSGAEVKVGIGTTTPDQRLQVLGDVRIGASGRFGCLLNFDGSQTWGICPSDVRLKRDIAPFAPVLDRVAQLRPVRFTWRGDEFPERHLGTARASGLIAQDVERVFPDMVSSDESGYKLVNYSELPYVILEAVIELKAENDALRARAEKKDEQISKLTEQVEALARAMAALGNKRR
jgi:hypothetical protein